MSPVAVVFNPVKARVDRMQAAVRAEAERAGLGEPLWFETSATDAGRGQTRAALDAGADLIVASGGDGTVRAVAGALRHTGVPLGIVPNGTGNLFARELGLPLANVKQAAAVAIDGMERPIDVGVVEVVEGDGAGTEHPFLVIAGLGIDADMITNTSPALKERLGWLAYIDGAFRSLPGAKPVRMKYQVDGRSEHVRQAQSLLVANVGALPGGMDLVPGAKIDDGVLDVAVVHPKTVFGWAIVWRTVVWENHVLRRNRFGRRLVSFREKRGRSVLTYSRGSSVRVVSDVARPAELDGDHIGMLRSAVFRADPLALIVRVPRE